MALAQSGAELPAQDSRNYFVDPTRAPREQDRDSDRLSGPDLSEQWRVRSRDRRILHPSHGGLEGAVLFQQPVTNRVSCPGPTLYDASPTVSRRPVQAVGEPAPWGERPHHPRPGLAARWGTGYSEWYSRAV